MLIFNFLLQNYTVFIYFSSHWSLLPPFRLKGLLPLRLSSDYLFISRGMYSTGSRRIEGRENIQRPGDNEYINTTYLPPEKTIQAVRYYNRRKEELKINSPIEANLSGTNRNSSGG